MQRLQRKEEIASLQQELDQITDEANRQIEKGNDAIVRLKSELRHLREVESARLAQEKIEAERSLEAARRRSDQLRWRSSGQGSNEVEELRQEVAVLHKQKESLLKMVLDIYGARGTPVDVVANLAGGDMVAQVRAMANGGNAVSGNPLRPSEGNLLPDPVELLASDAARNDWEWDN